MCTNFVRGNLFKTHPLCAKTMFAQFPFFNKTKWKKKNKKIYSNCVLHLFWSSPPLVRVSIHFFHSVRLKRNSDTWMGMSAIVFIFSTLAKCQMWRNVNRTNVEEKNFLFSHFHVKVFFFVQVDWMWLKTIRHSLTNSKTTTLNKITRKTTTFHLIRCVEIRKILKWFVSIHPG